MDNRCRERRLRKTTPIRPCYAESFQCIGPACEDTCCAGWTVPVDQATYEKYQALPESPLRLLIHSSVARAPEGPEAAAPGRSANFATIRMNKANQCPLLTAGRLCGIQTELGHDMLSHACATYPRIVSSVGGQKEMALSMSCPEAVRLVLLTPDLPFSGGDSEAEAATDAKPESAPPLPPDFHAIRAVVLKVVRNRLYPLWQRLFLLDILCRRLDLIGRGELNRTATQFLADFEATVASGSLCAAMETLPVDRAAQLDVVLRLAGLMLHKSNIRPRFVECVQAFTAGIGNGPGATLESLAAHYAHAHDRFYAPFFDRQPHIMENLIVNTILQHQFPFGREAMRSGVQPDMAREFALLAVQFALTRGLLIGVAGFHGAAFSAGHAVFTVQAASKHFEHHPEFLSMAHALLVESNMNGARGLAILLRAAAARAAGAATIPLGRAKSAPAIGGERSA